MCRLDVQTLRLYILTFMQTATADHHPTLPEAAVVLGPTTDIEIDIEKQVRKLARS